MAIKLLAGNLMFGVLVVGWYLLFEGQKTVLVSGIVLAFLAFIAGTCMGWALNPRRQPPAPPRPVRRRRGGIDPRVFEQIV